jgi:L-alanine-DL-glutamate epimerase-like enolase superfamily enzyme
MSNIARIESFPYALALQAPLHWGRGHQMNTLDHILVKVTLESGAVGLAEANPRPTIYGETPESVRAILQREIAPALVGQTLDNLNDLPKLLGCVALLKNNHSARAAVDMALWGALAAEQGTHVADLLGAAQSAVRVSYILGTGDLEDVLQEAKSVFESGVRVLKVKVGKDIAAELQLVMQLRMLLPDVDLYLDANECLIPEAAAGILSSFAALGAHYCEEPLAVWQIPARAALREQGIMPLIGDDSAFTPDDLRRELLFNTFDILNLKPSRNGFTQSLAMAADAQAADKGIMFGSQASSLLGALCTLMIAAASDGQPYPAEGTFWLKVKDSGTLPLDSGFITRDALKAAYTATVTRLLEDYAR